MGLDFGSNDSQNKQDRKFEHITNIETVIEYRGTDIVLDEATFKTKATNDGEYRFIAQEENSVIKWYLFDEEVTLAEYGITVSGDVMSGDDVYVYYFDGEIESYGYNEFTEVADGIDFDFVNFSASLPVDIEIGDSFFRGWINSIKSDIAWTVENGFVLIRNGNKADVTIKLVLAKKRT